MNNGAMRNRSVRSRRIARATLAALAAVLAAACHAPNEHLEAKNAVGPYSAGVVTSGPLVFLSGKIGPTGGTFEEEVKGALDAVETDLARARATLEDVVSVNVYLTDMALFDEMNRLYADRFPPPHPARTTIAVANLPKGAHIEVQVVARVP
jgi:2-iminobutanoate/2-iminopropanoate deaminase